MGKEGGNEGGTLNPLRPLVWSRVCAVACNSARSISSSNLLMG